ncbi:MAG TPA: peptidylprolyl isomerase [Bryobacteraceae bacterium]|nr:peptidylprolyl isomerase [Bryobacteraceae bacterium]
MRYKLILAGALVSVAVMAADVTVMDEIVCKVNGDIITRSELERDRRLMEGELRSQGMAAARLQEAIRTATANGLRDRVDRLLLVQKGKELNLKVESDVNKQLADIQRRSQIADPEKFQQFVREQLGQSYEDYKADLTNGILTQEVIREEVLRKIQFKREELEAYYNAHKEDFQRKERVFLREILVAAQGNDDVAMAAAERKAKDLVARARKGEKFPELAVANSDALSAQQGGALDPYVKGELAPEIEALVWDQARGYVTDPLKRATGYLVLKVDDHQKEGLAAFEEVQTEVQDKLFEPRRDPAVRAFLTKLRTEAFLEIKPGFEDSGAAPGKDTSWSDPAELKPETVTKEEVAARPRRKHLLGVVPLPGTSTTKGGTSSSR